MNQRQERTRSSVLWAAWADALGFISELTSAENLRRRTRGRELSHPMEWSRIVGGRMGVRVDLPTGCYSDDTQLRLATSRAIANHGFDVEAFARVELPVWPGYALGGGRASRAAAAAMARQQANWANNFFTGWENAGGNGAAMRIQPHVYAARNLKSLDHLDDVVRNAIVTHGHPRGIVGAVFHAVALTYALEHGTVPDPLAFPQLLNDTRFAVVAFSRQPELHSYWRPQWERKMRRSFDDAWGETVDEINGILATAQHAWEGLRAAGQDRHLAFQAYDELVRVLRLDNEQTRGSGTLTSAAALLLASAFPDHPAQAAQIAASRLYTDTDTIGTMAAAIVGAASPRPLISSVLDEEYLTNDADRLYSISQGELVEPFPYPDLLRWEPPKHAVDASGLVVDRLALAGISYLTVLGGANANKDGVWVWARTEFGQSVLIKHRHDLRQLPEGNYPTLAYSDQDLARAARQQHPKPSRSVDLNADAAEQPTLFEDLELDLDDDPRSSSFEELFARLSRTGYRNADLGEAFKKIARSGTVDDVRRLAELVANYIAESE